MKNKIYLILILFLTSITVNATFFITPKPPSIKADSFVLIDHNSKEIIASKNSHKQRAPASLTKLMTSYVVFKRIKEGFIKLGDEIVISEKAWKTEGSRSFLKVNTKITLETLLKGMIIQSGNDASVALSEHTAGTEVTFVVLMNKYAIMLGMDNTNFENASGLPNKAQVTTSYDMALLSSAIIKEFPEYYKWYGQKYFTHNEIKQPNRNTLLWSDKTIDGLKTGFTKKAGYCLATSSKKEGMRLISVVLGASSNKNRLIQTKKILDYGFRFFETQKIINNKQNVIIYKGAKNKVNIGLQDDYYLTLERGKFRSITQQLKIKKKIIAPIKNGDKVGEMNIIFDKKIIKTFPLVALNDIEKAGFFGSMIDTIALWFF